MLSDNSIPKKAERATAIESGPIGAYRRRIEIATRQIATSSSEARVAIEDDHHHFRITVFAQDGKVSEVGAQALRTPNLICPSATSRLSELEGKVLDPSYAAVLRYTDIRQHCTHLIEMASLGMAMLAGGVPHRIYEAQVRYDPDARRPVDSRSTATLLRDGEQILRWRLSSLEITDPAPFAGQSVLKGFSRLVDRLPHELTEPALVLRRAVFTSFGRGLDLDGPDAARNATPGQCWAWQPQRAERALRNIGSTLDFDPCPELLTADDRAWISFNE